MKEFFKKIFGITTSIDKIIILIALAISLSVFLGICNNKSDNLKVVVEVNGIVYGQYNLENDESIIVKSDFGYNKIEIKQGYVYVSETSCPDKFELNNKISREGQAIVCLPNRMIIKIVGAENTVDGVTY